MKVFTNVSFYKQIENLRDGDDWFEDTGDLYGDHFKTFEGMVDYVFDYAFGDYVDVNKSITKLAKDPRYSNCIEIRDTTEDLANEGDDQKHVLISIASRSGEELEMVPWSEGGSFYTWSLEISYDVEDIERAENVHESRLRRGRSLRESRRPRGRMLRENKGEKNMSRIGRRMIREAELDDSVWTIDGDITFLAPDDAMSVANNENEIDNDRPFPTEKELGFVAYDAKTKNFGSLVELIEYVIDDVLKGKAYEIVLTQMGDDDYTLDLRTVVDDEGNLYGGYNDFTEEGRRAKRAGREGHALTVLYTFVGIKGPIEDDMEMSKAVKEAADTIGLEYQDFINLHIEESRHRRGRMLKEANRNHTDFIPYTMRQYYNEYDKKWIPCVVYINSSDNGEWWIECFDEWGTNELGWDYEKFTKNGTSKCDPEEAKQIEDIFISDCKEYGSVSPRRVSRLRNFGSGNNYIGKV